MIMRNIWKKQNDLVFNQEFLPPFQVARQAIDEVEILHSANPSEPQVTNQQEVKLNPLREGELKANWDAGVCNITQRTSIGIVIKDSIGAVLACLSSSRNSDAQHPTLAECWALSRTIEFCSEIGVHGVLLEGDALTVIKATQRPHWCCTWYGDIIEDIKLALRNNLGWKLSFTHREGNGVAHSPAKLGLKSLIENVWLEDFPSSISHDVLSDMNY